MPKTLRRKVMEVAHDSIFGGHFGIKKTKAAFKQISTGLACKGMLLVSADNMMYVKRRLIKDPSPCVTRR